MRTRLFLLAWLLAPVGAWADSLLFAAAPYNVFVLHDFTSSNSDVEGGLAAGGTIKISSYSVGLDLTASELAAFPGQYTLVGGGDLQASNGTLAKGNAFDGTTGGVKQNFTIASGTLTSSGASPINFSLAGTQLMQLSASLSASATTPGDSCTTAYGTTTCTVSASGTINVTNPNIFNVSNIIIKSTAPAGTIPTVVINVAGVHATLGCGGFSAFDGGKTVLFNYYEATSLTLGCSAFTMSLLAPKAVVSADNGGTFSGNFIAGSFFGHEQFNNDDLFSGTLAPAVPEPATLLLMGAGVVGLVIRRRSKRIGQQ